MRWLERVGLKGFEKKYPNQLSGGMQQRVGLARALANDAPILLMDEAFSALDPLIRVDMQTILLDLQKEIRKTIVFITHDLDEALRLGDSIAILRDGEIIQQGSSQDIVLRPADDYIESFVREVNRGRLADEIEHQVGGRRSARCGDDRRFGDKDIAAQIHERKLLHEAVVIVPVNRRLLIVQKPRLGQNVGTGTQRADAAAMGAAMADGGQQARCGGTLHPDAGQEEKVVRGWQGLEGMRHPRFRPIGRARKISGFRCECPCIKVRLREEVRDSQWLDRAGKCQMRKILHQQKNKILGRCGCDSVHADLLPQAYQHSLTKRSAI
jgi:hypothetical protein